MDIEPSAAGAMSDRDLVVQFESLGDNCELGLVQRRVGVEPLGLLRFAGAPLRHLLDGLRNRFEGLADPSHVRLSPEHGEYMVKLTKYDYTYHTHVNVGEAEPDKLHQQQCRTIRFLKEKLLNDLANPQKIAVFRQNEPLSAMDLIDLRVALSAFGPNVLLWVAEACGGHPPGSLVVVDDRLMVGYVRSLADREDVPNLDLAAWLTVLRQAYDVWRNGMPLGVTDASAGASQRCSEITFGVDGNAAAAQGAGWSGAEAGFTWSVGERSVLTLDNPGASDEYWLEMDVIPYIRLPLLPRQRLDVIVGGVVVSSFDPLPRGVVTCVLPGNLVGKDKVELVLNHPHAASPMLVMGETDDRRLAAAFRRVSLFCT